MGAGGGWGESGKKEDRRERSGDALAVVPFPLGHVTSVTSRSAVGHVAALVTSHINGLLLFNNTREQTTETMPLALKQ